jgi:PAS domain S-box-containing protein
MIAADDYQRFFELSPNLLCIADFNGYFKKVNQSVSDLLGYSFDELYSKPIDEFIHKDDVQTTREKRNELHNKIPLFELENRYITKNGDVVWLSWTSFPIVEDRIVYAVAKNITYKKKLELERVELLKNLTKTNRELKQLSYTTSHDLRAPLSNIITCLDLIKTSQIKDEETLELLEILKMCGENLKNTLDTYVDAIAGNHNLHTDIESLNLSETLENVLQSIQSIVDSSGIKIYTNFSETENVLFNKSFLESIFLNLLTNSIKYSQKDTIPKVKITSQSEKNFDLIIFTDNGVGFNMEEVDGKIFGLNQKFHNNDDSKGIGLYLIYNYITDLGGKITVESEVNKGTTFKIYFKKE